MKLLANTKLLSLLFIVVGLAWLTNTAATHHQHHLRPDTPTKIQDKKLLTIPVEKREHGPEKMQKKINFLKNAQTTLRRKRLTPGAINLVQKSQSTNVQPQLVEIQLNNYLDTQYSGIIAVGNKNNKLNVVFDTGSTLLWVNSVRCTEIECQEHVQYDYTQSKHWQPILENDLYSTMFGSGELSGVLSIDWLFIGNITIKDYEFAEIVNQDSILDDAAFDGVCGLSFPEEDEGYGNLISIIDAMKEQDLLEKNMFSFYLRRDAGVEDSKIIFGGYDETLLGSQPSWFPVIGTDYWMVQGSRIYIGDQDSGVCNDDCYFIMDTGTSILTGPSEQLNILLDSIEVDDGCQNYYQLPDITFQIGDQNYTLLAEDYILAIGNNEAFLPYAEPTQKEIVDCVSVFYPMDLPGEENGNVWIMGDTFLSKFYMMYDRDNMQVGIARQIDFDYNT